jgi:hypothetical protein
VSAPEEREQNWYPVSQVGWFTAHIREGIAVTGHQLELLQPALARPGRLDDAAVARIIRVHQEQAATWSISRTRRISGRHCPTSPRRNGPR